MTRVCPNPILWNEVFNRLSKVADNHGELSKPPVPLVLAGWVYSNDAEKMARWNQTVEWARDAGCEEITALVPDEDFYFTEEVTKYQIGPLGGPMYGDWDFEKKDRPEKEAVTAALQGLMMRWPDVAVGFSDATRPVGFTGAKARRLVVAVTMNAAPPWGDWDRLSLE